MALDINSDLDFGMTGNDKQVTGLAAVMISSCVCLLAGYNFRSFCRKSESFNRSALKYDRDIEKYNKRIKNYKTSIPNEDSPGQANARSAPASGDFHNLNEDYSSSEVRRNMDDSDEEEYESANPVPRIRKESGLKVEGSGSI